MILEAVGLSLLTALVVGAVGLLVVAPVARRSLAGAVVVAPLVVLVAVAVSVLVSANAMFISEHDRQVVLVVLATVTPVALTLGWVVATGVRRQQSAASAERTAALTEREREQSRRELVGWLSHDLRTPLAGIRVMAEAIGDGHAPADGSYERRIVGEVDRLSGMVGDLLALSRLHSASPTLDRAPVDLGDMVSDAVAATGPLGSARGVTVAPAATAAGPPRVVAPVDAGDLSRAVRNLLDNAVRHTPGGGQVLVDLVTGTGDRSTDGREPRLATVTVQDGCGGIAPADLQRVFDPGWRGTSARSPVEHEGAGLGLAIARGIARAHGGDVRVVNVPGGCRFELSVPLDPPAGPPLRPRRAW